MCIYLASIMVSRKNNDKKEKPTTGKPLPEIQKNEKQKLLERLQNFCRLSEKQAKKVIAQVKPRKM